MTSHSPLPTLLALDTSTEQCSVALLMHGEVHQQRVPTARGHADMILGMIDALLAEAGVTLSQLNAIAFGRGPGAFTGVRLAIGVAQGLALARDLPVLPVSDLAAIALQGAQRVPSGSAILVCMDARMNEIYTGNFAVDADGLVRSVDDERVCAPDHASDRSPALGLGAGFAAYASLRARFPQLITESALPGAGEVVRLAQRDWLAGAAMAPELAQPVYLRDQVVHVKNVT